MTVYVNRVVLAGPGDVGLGDLVRVWGGVSAEAQEALAQSVAVMADKVLYLPVPVFQAQLEAAFGEGSIIVGSRCIVAPRNSFPEAETYLLERIAGLLEAQGLLGDARTEITFLSNVVKGTPPQEGSPSLQVQKNPRGGAEVSFSLLGTGGNSVTGKLSLPGGTMQPVAADGLKSGATVQVVFRKGPITIEMEGKTLAAGVVGARVGVYVSDSQKRFSGRVVDAREVEVELP
jgi:hypothetical protein